MTGNALQNIEQIDGSLWGDADQFRANAKLVTSKNATLAIEVRRDGSANVAWTLTRIHHDAGIGISRPRGFA